MLFGKAKSQKEICSKEIFEKYELASGQKINFEKLAILFSRNTDADVEIVCQILDISKEN